jgi:DNA-binding NarL/FixJ family response regulator
MSMIRVSVLSDDRIFCDGLRRILGGDSAVAFIALDERIEAPAAIRAAIVDVLLVDARMEHALDLCERIDRDGAGPAIVFVEVAEDEASATRALAAGARGVLRKSARWEDVSKATHLVAHGGVWAPRQVVVGAWLKEMRRTRESQRLGEALIGAQLTAREHEVLQCAAAGLCNKELSDRLGISEATVKAHLTRIFQKLGLHGRARLAAAYHGVVAPIRRPA